MPYRLSFLDYSDEKSGFQVATGPINVATLAGVTTQTASLKSAIDAITLGTLSTEQLTAFDNLLSNIDPTDKEAQREKKWLISYIDNTPFLDPPVNSIVNPGYQKAFSNTIPTADLAQLTTPGTDNVDFTVGVWPAFVTAFQALARSPYGGQPLITQIRYVGRNL